MATLDSGRGTQGCWGGIVLAALLLVGCGGGAPPADDVVSPVGAESPSVGAPSVAVSPAAAGANAGLLGPWQAEPMPIAAATWAAIDRACRVPVGDQREPLIGREFRLAVVDARGEGILQAMFINPGGGTASCEDIDVAADGSVRWRASASRDDAPQPALGPFELRVSGGTLATGAPGTNLAITRAITYGAAGTGIASVVIDIPGSRRLTASLGNRAWIAWWPGAWPTGTRILGLSAAGIAVAEEYP